MSASTEDLFKPFKFQVDTSPQTRSTPRGTSRRRPVVGRGGGLRLNVASNRLTLPRLLDLIEALPCERVIALDVSQNDLGDAAPQALARCLPNLQELHLSGCGIGMEGVSGLLSELRRCAAPASPRADSSNHQSNGCRYSPSGGSSNIRSNGCQYGTSNDRANGSPNASSKTPQTSPQRAGSPASPRGSPKRHREAGGIAEDHCLQILDLSACSPVENAVPELCAYLAEPGCSLTSLDLSFNGLGPEAVRHLGNCLRTNSTLRHLQLNHCHLREEAASLFKSLGSEDCRAPLVHLCVSRNHLSLAAWQELGVFLGSSRGKKIELLDVSGNSLANEAASRSVGAGLFAHLSASTSKLVADTSKVSAELRLDLSGTRPFFDVTFGRWDVASSHILTALRATTCRVVEVILDQCTSLSESAMPTLARICFNMRVFSFCGHGVGEAFVHALSELARAAAGTQPKLASSTSATSPNGPTSAVAVGLELATPTSPSRPPHRSLRFCTREIRLNDAALQDHSVVLLADALAKLRSIRKDGRDIEVLEVAGNHLSVHAIESLAPMLTQNKYLHKLVLSRNRLKQMGAAKLSELLPLRSSNSTCTLDLCLRHCSFTTEGVVQIWQAVLEDSSRIARIDLAENSLDGEGIAAMQAMLPASRRSNPVLRHVNLLPNPCGNAPVIKLLLKFAPWQGIPLHDGALDAQTIVQLLHALGSNLVEDDVDVMASPRSKGPRPAAELLDADGRPRPAWSPKLRRASIGCEGSPISPRSPRSPKQTAPVKESHDPPFTLSLSGAPMLPKQWHWAAVADAIKGALAPDTQAWSGDAPKGWNHGRRMMRTDGTQPWKRFGGCGADLIMDLSKCDLGKVGFKVPTSIAVLPASQSPTGESSTGSKGSSLARNARREVRMQTLPTTVEICALTAGGLSKQPSLAARARGRSSCGSAFGSASGILWVASDAAKSEEGIASTSGIASLHFETESGDSQRGDIAYPPDELRSRGQSRIVQRSRSAGNMQTLQRQHPTPLSVRALKSSASSVSDLASCRLSPKSTASPRAANGSRPPTPPLANGTQRAATPTAAGRSSQGFPDGPRQVHRIIASSLKGQSFERMHRPDLEVSTVLRELRGIENLRLESCCLDDRWIASLCRSGGTPKWSTVRFLDLSNNDLTAACCQALASVVTGGLEVLIADGNQIRSEGFEVLCTAIKPKSKCSLRWLSVINNGIGYPGGFVAADLLSRPTGCPLQGLCLSRNPLSSGEMIAIFRALCRQAGSATSPAAGVEAATFTGAAGGRTVAKELFIEAAGGRTLEVLELASCGGDSPAGPLVPQLCRALEQCPALSVDMRGCPLSTVTGRNGMSTAAGADAREVLEGTSAAPSELARFVRDGSLML